MKLLIFLDHDIMIRHFALSRVFESFIEAGHEPKIILPSNTPKRVTVELNALNCAIPVEHIKMSPERVFLWKRLFFVERFRINFDPFAQAVKSMQTKALGWKASLMFNVLALPGLRNAYTYLIRRQLTNSPDSEVKSIIEREKPDVVIHPTVLAGVFFDDLIEYCDTLNIPMITVMNSWDNPSTKHGAIKNPEHLLVWGEQTWRHARDYMKLSPSQLTKFGAAQFDIYRSPPLQSEIEFRRSHAIPDDLPILLYAGSSKGSNETKHLHLIEDMIDNGDLPKMAILYRPHPWGGGGAEGGNLLDEPWRHVFMEHSMVDYLEQLRSNPDASCMPDYNHTHNVLSNVDYVVSPLSTIVIEAALHGKPVLCHMPIDEEDAKHFQMVKDLPHFVDLFEMDIFPVSWGLENLKSGLQTLIKQKQEPDIDERLKEACHFFIEPSTDSWRSRIVSFTENFAQRKSDKRSNPS